MEEIIVVPCTQEKVWDASPDSGPVPAKDAYAKDAFRQWRRYAEGSGKRWFVLSTKFGLIQPDQPITRYNVPVSSAVRDLALRDRLKRQGREFGLEQADKVILLDWEKFEPLVRAAVGDSGTTCVLRRVCY